jgi:hypothetical protein
VAVTVAGSAATFTWVNNSLIQMDAAPANGAAVLVYRTTPLTAPLVDFADGATLVAADLDTNARQSIYTQQELDDALVDGLAGVIPNGDKGDITTSAGGSVWTIDSGAVVEAKLGTGAVTETKIGTGAVTETKIGTGAVTETKIGTGAVTSSKIADGTIVNADVNASAGIVASKLAFTQSGTGATARTVDSKLKDVVSVKDFGAVGDGVADDTTAIQAAINSLPAGGGCVYIPRGLYLVDPAVGINVVSGLTLCGDGRACSQLVAKPVGGTILKRAFNNAGPNAYVDSVTIRDIGIILRHPATASPSNYYQVAIQYRHITRSLIEDVYIGNYPGGVSSGLTSPAAQEDARQGYGVSIGSTSAGDAAYAGGEVNTCRRVMCSGVRYGFTIDNPTFDTPAGGSAAYTTVIDCCEVSAAEVGISQYGQYGAGCTFSNNVIQAIDQMRGSSATAYSIYIDGYEHFLYGGYNESPFTDYELYLSSSSRRNRINTWLSDDGTFFDGGIGNVIERINGTTNKWSLSVNNKNLQNGIAKAWVSFYWNGTAIVLNSAYNVTGVLRVGAGDYRIDFAAGVFVDANYTAALAGRVNVSGNAGTITNYTNKSTANYRILCYNIGTVAYEDFLDITATFWGNP